jgi:hypothetical protein
LDLILEDGHIEREEFKKLLLEAEDLGAQLIAFWRKVREEGTRLWSSSFNVHSSL